MKICFLGLENLPVLAPEFSGRPIGGAQVQQTLLARALARAGHDVSMVVGDYGQADGRSWHAIRTFKAYAPDAGVPVLRFIHPRWTGIWRALRRADADVYYTSCAGMQVGLLAAFCRRYGKRFVFRIASDSDCVPAKVLVRHARDRWLYGWGLRRADAILVQTAAQASLLARHFGLPARQAAQLVGRPETEGDRDRDIGVLWINNLRPLKRPELLLALAAELPGVRFQIIGGSLAGEEALYRQICDEAAALANVEFRGRLPYAETNAAYARAKILLNTSDIEGFPNTYLQSWVRGVPVVARFDPDRLIEREGLGATASSLADLRSAIVGLLDSPTAWQDTSNRCRAFMAREFGETRILGPYIETFESLHRASVRGGSPIPVGEGRRA